MRIRHTVKAVDAITARKPPARVGWVWAGVRVVAALMAVAAVAGACDKSRNPFWVLQPEPEKDARMLYLPDRAGIVVNEVEGIDPAHADALTRALVAALQGANVPAGSGDGAGNRDSQILQARGQTRNARPDGVAVEIVWDLYSNDGLLIGSGTASNVLPRASWDAVDAAALGAFANRIAPEVAGLIQVDMGEEAAANRRTRIHFAGLADAPGDGDEVLPPLVSYLFAKNGYEVVESGAGVFKVVGRYRSEPAPGGREKIGFEWRVFDAGGEEIGLIEQENVIARGALDGPWGEAAFFIAEGAVEGVHTIIEAKKEAAAKAGS